MRTSFRGVRQLLWGLLPLSLVPVGCALSACSSSDPAAEPVDSGVPDSDATICDAGVYYGPMPCTSDEQCESTGQGSWCDKSHTFSGPCGEVSWPICKGTPEAGKDVDTGVPDADAGENCDAGVYYGPMPCTSDEQCESTGQGSWCDKSNTFSGPCGEVSWPICKGTPEGGKDGEAGTPEAGEDGEAGTPEAGED